MVLDDKNHELTSVSCLDMRFSMLRAPTSSITLGWLNITEFQKAFDEAFCFLRCFATISWIERGHMDVHQ